MLFTIYPDNSDVHDQETLQHAPIWIFLIGTALTTVSYASIFRPLATENNLIIYVLDTNPLSIPKTLQGFQNKVSGIINDIQSFYDIPATSNLIYLGGHSVGGIIALNSLFPDNFGINSSPLIVNSLPFQIKGLICFDPVDGEKGNSGEYPFKTKYDPVKPTQYITATGEVSPFPILIFASAVPNTGVDPAYGGQRSFQLLANPFNFPANKYCFVSASKYHHMDYTDPVTRAYVTDTTRLWPVDQQSDYVKGFQAFLRAKIVSFILNPPFDPSTFDDLYLLH